jgi:hypothetical protein
MFLMGRALHASSVEVKQGAGSGRGNCWWACRCRGKLFPSRNPTQLQIEQIRAGSFKQSMGARNRVGIGLSYRPARLHRLAELNPWN